MMKNFLPVIFAGAMAASTASLSAQSPWDELRKAADKVVSNPIGAVQDHLEQVVNPINSAKQILAAPVQTPTRMTQQLVPGIHVNPHNPMQPLVMTTPEQAMRNWNNLPRVIDNTLSNPAAAPVGQMLTEAIEQGERRAISSSQPLSPEFRAALRGVVPQDVLDFARVSVNWNASYGSAIQDYLLKYHADAVTLNRVIILRSADMLRPDSRENRERMIHELTHVGQYRELSTLGFATWYVGDIIAGRYPQLETDAYRLAGHLVDQTSDTYGDYGAMNQDANAGYSRALPSWNRSPAESLAPRQWNRRNYPGPVRSMPMPPAPMPIPRGLTVPMPPPLPFGPMPHPVFIPPPMPLPLPLPLGSPTPMPRWGGR